MNNSGKSTTGKRYSKFFFGLLIGATLLYLSAQDVSWPEIVAHIESISYAWVLFALVLYWMELGLRLARWRILLSQSKLPIPGYFLGIAFFSGYAANNVLPAKLGEAFRADLLGRLANSSRLTAFGSIIVERLLDMITILVMTAWGVWFATTTHYDRLEDIRQGLSLLSLPVALLVVVIGWLVLRKNAPVSLGFKSLTDKVQNLIVGLNALRKASTSIKIIGGTLLIWMLNTLGMWSILAALEVELSATQTVLLIGLTGISAAIPAAPAGIGTLQYAFHLAAELFGFPASAALVASTIVQVVLLGSATLVGAIVYGCAVTWHLLPDKASR